MINFPEGLNPLAELQDVFAGQILARCLQQITALGTPDVVGEEGAEITEIASRLGADADALQRTLRLLASRGFFSLEGRAVPHTDLSRFLRKDHPRSLRDFVMQFASDFNWQCYGLFEHTLRTGQPASFLPCEGGPWKWRQDHPEEAELFNRAMEARARGRIPLIIDAYDFSGFARIADIGGGMGHLVRSVLAKYPQAQGTLFDLPEAISQARQLSSVRLSFQPGDFFRDPLPEADAYLLMDILHDWPDAESREILNAARKAARLGSKLLIIEVLLPEGPEPHWGKALDIQMLVLFAGRQRSLAQFGELLAHCGFSAPREIPIGNGFSIVEAEAV